MGQITPREYAAKHSKPYSTVLTWIKLGILPAEKHVTPHGNFYLINSDTPAPKTKRGPKGKANAQR
jgi:hypothetical protein